MSGGSFAISCAMLCACVGAGCSQIDAPPRRQRAYVEIQAPPSANFTRECPASGSQAWDYFPDKVEFRASSQLQVVYRKSFKVVTFTPGVHPDVPLQYVLYQCGTPRPAGFPAATFIEVPAQRAVLNNPVFGSTVARLGIVDRLYGVNGLEGYTNATILNAAAEGRIHELGTRGPSTIENAVALDIDVVFLFYSANPTFNLHPALQRLGVGAVGLGDIFESTALGRAEWVKFMALFFNEEARANRIVDTAAARYRELAARSMRAVPRPLVLQGFPANRDTWTAVGGGNFFASLIKDAGADYFLDDATPRANVPMPFERAMMRSFPSRIWIGLNGVNRVRATRDLVTNAPQIVDLAPVQMGAVYGMDLHMNRERAFPYSDHSLDRPDVVLADLVSILHPELLPGYQPAFIRRLP